MADFHAPVACFGKLPCYGDYLRVNVSQPTARAVQELMLHGRQGQPAGESGSGEAGGCRDAAIETRLRILFGLPGSRELLVGVLRPSRDSGGRHFPFAIFTYLTRRAYGRHYALLPLALAPVWEALDDTWDCLAEATTREDFAERLESVELPELEEVKDARGEYQGRMREGVRRAFEGSNGASPAHLAGNLSGLVKRLHGGEDLSVQLPVSRDLGEACFDASVWVDMLNRQFRLKRFEPSVFLDERPAVAGRWVVLRFGETGPSDYLDIVGRPAGEAFIRPAHSTAPTARVDSNSSKEMTYGDLLAVRG